MRRLLLRLEPSPDRRHVCAVVLARGPGRRSVEVLGGGSALRGRRDWSAVAGHPTEIALGEDVGAAVSMAAARGPASLTAALEALAAWREIAA